jgi:glycerophosphoryl diester phosphodiesterase
MTLRGFEIIGHRGAMSVAPENTLESFARAIEMGATTVEFDVRLLADGRFVIIHDDTLDRTTNGTGSVMARSSAEIRSLDAGSWFSPAFSGARVPFLDEVIDLCKGKVRLLVELKAHFAPDYRPERQLVDLLRRHGVLPDVQIISFDHSMPLRVKEIDPSIETGINYNCAPVEPLVDALLARAGTLHPSMSGSVTAAFVDEAHARGIRVSATTNDRAELLRLIRAGVDGLCTNYLDRLTSAVAEVGGVRLRSAEA